MSHRDPVLVGLDAAERFQDSVDADEDFGAGRGRCQAAAFAIARAMMCECGEHATPNTAAVAAQKRN